MELAIVFLYVQYWSQIGAPNDSQIVLRHKGFSFMHRMMRVAISMQYIIRIYFYTALYCSTVQYAALLYSGYAF